MHPGGISSGGKTNLNDLYKFGDYIFSGHYHINKLYKSVSKKYNALQMVGSPLQLNWSDYNLKKYIYTLNILDGNALESSDFEKADKYFDNEDEQKKFYQAIKNSKNVKDVAMSTSSKNESLREDVEMKQLFHNDNGTDYEIIERSKSKKHALLNKGPQWIIAWNCPENNEGSWGQGHYFFDEESARKTWEEKYLNEDLDGELPEDFNSNNINKLGSNEYEANGKTVASAKTTSLNSGYTHTYEK